MTYLVIILFVVVAIGAIIYAQRVAQKEHEQRLLIARSKRLLQRANEIWETITLASQYIGNTDVIEGLIQYYQYFLNQREQLFPQTDTTRLMTQADIFKNQYNPNNIVVELNSDSEIKKCKQCFAKTSKILKAAAAKSIISPETYGDLKDYLKFTLLQLEVSAYEKIGDQAGENKNPAVATNYYKYAKKLLIESDLNFDGKHEHIRNITEKNQILFGNIIKEKMNNNTEQENTLDEHGFPSDLNVMSGKARKD